jgi:ATP-dependent helicase/nuclease subunit B
VPAHFLLGPAGSGKTFRCLAEIRAELGRSPEGAPLVLLAPKQATFQLERQLLSERALPGYVRLRILSFERLARFVFEQLGRPLPQLLAEEGRVMVLRALLAQRQRELELFRASARLPGFAQELSKLLRELQQHHLTAGRLEDLAQRVQDEPTLGRKLRDLARLWRAYQEWLAARHLQDADSLLTLAADELHVAARQAPSAFRVAGLWLDGFAQMTPQERRLLAALVPCCERATLAFCLESEPAERRPWHSLWTLIGQTYQQCHADIAGIPGLEVTVEEMGRQPERSRFTAQPALQHLEQHWSQPAAFTIYDLRFTSSIRVVACPNPDAEATFAAREILRFVRESGGRFRDVAVLVRDLEAYHDPLRRVLTRFGIPFFLDRREPITHHPLAELTRAALRTLAFGWQQTDWFAALKTGLVPAHDRQIDELENEALARGWAGAVWKQPFRREGADSPGSRLETVRERLVAPFDQLERALGNAPTGAQLAEALAAFWQNLNVPRTLEDWSARPFAFYDLRFTRSLHATVWTQMQAWLENAALAFPAEAMPLREWLPIVEAGLARLSVGVIPPSLDQVLVGAIDRSRNPDLRCVFVVGLNETVFPAPPPPCGLLTEAERARLEQHGHPLGPDRRAQLGHERFYGYIACTRARERLVATFAQRDANGQELNPSVFVEHLRRLFPAMEVERFSGESELADAQHAVEMVVPLLKAAPTASPPLARLAALPLFQPVLASAADLGQASRDQLSVSAVERAYGAELDVSISALEDFAACPFKFFVRRGLRAGERQQFEVDPRERGNFQHAVLRDFHEHLLRAGKRWRDLTPDEARQLIRDLGEAQLGRFREGLFAASEGRQFTARLLIEGLEKLIATLVQWNREQYAFDPSFVELEFGPEKALPGWRLDVDGRHALVLRGRMDRVDLCRREGADAALAVVVDYKSSEQKIDRLRLLNGLELQLLAYAGLLRHLSDPQGALHVPALLPAGAFYVNLRGTVKPAKTRAEALQDDPTARATAYQHLGRFDGQWLRLFDTRTGAERGDQFKYSIKRDGELSKNSEALPAGAFTALLDLVEAQLRQMGQEIYAGRVLAAPYRQGHETACNHCEYRGICRFDPWVRPYRRLKDVEREA